MRQPGKQRHEDNAPGNSRGVRGEASLRQLITAGLQERMDGDYPDSDTKFGLAECDFGGIIRRKDTDGSGVESTEERQSGGMVGLIGKKNRLIKLSRQMKNSSPFSDFSGKKHVRDPP